MTDPNANSGGQIPWQQNESGNASTSETNMAQTQPFASVELPTQAIEPTEQPTQAFTPVEQSTLAFAPVESPTESLTAAGQSPQPATQSMFVPPLSSRTEYGGGQPGQAGQPMQPTQTMPAYSGYSGEAAGAMAAMGGGAMGGGAMPPTGSVPPAYPNSMPSYSGGSVPPAGTSPTYANGASAYPGGPVPPQQPYNPYTQGGRPYGGMPPENQKYNGLAIAGFVCSFFIALVGLILSIVGLGQIKKQGGKGKGLAIAGIIISAVSMILTIVLVVSGVIGAGAIAGAAIDSAKSDSSYSRSLPDDSDANSDANDDLDNLDDALDDTLDETYDDMTDGDYGVYDSVQAFVDSSEFQDSVASEANSFAGTGITFKYHAEGDTLVYEYVLGDEYASMGDSFASSLGGSDSIYQSTANMLGSTCKTASGKASLRVVMHTVSGQSLFDQTWTEE